jgi:cytochrome c-type biogenesis protein CcmE
VTDTASLTDLTPRPPRPTRARRVTPIVLVVVIVVAIGALLFKTLGDASLFFKNADQAVAERDKLGTERFRLQGTVMPDTVQEGEVDGQGAVMFSVSFNGTEVDVVHVGNPPELFKPDVPVVLEGRWTNGVAPNGTFTHGVNDGWYFASDRMLVKHDSQYESENKARLREADEGGQQPVTSEPSGARP